MRERLRDNENESAAALDLAQQQRNDEIEEIARLTSENQRMRDILIKGKKYISAS